MKPRKKYFKTLKGLQGQLGGGYLTAEMMKNRRAQFKDGWYHVFAISDEADDEFWEGLASVVWSRPTPQHVSNLRLYGRGWYMGRLWREKSGRYTYCAGQDYPSEIRSIQREMR